MAHLVFPDTQTNAQKTKRAIFCQLTDKTVNKKMKQIDTNKNYFFNFGFAHFENGGFAVVRFLVGHHRLGVAADPHFHPHPLFCYDSGFPWRRGSGSLICRVHALDAQERVDEIARMLSGEQITSAARDAARSLIG